MTTRVTTWPWTRGSSGESITYDLDDWSDLERQAITERLREAGVPHGWEGPQLLIAAVDEGVVENILDIVEGESADEADEPLDPERDQMAYDVEELEDEELDALADALRAAGIAHAWGDERAVRLRRRRAGRRRAVRPGAAPRRARARGRREPEGDGDRRAAGRRLRRRRPAAARRRGHRRARRRCWTSPSRSTTSRPRTAWAPANRESVCAAVGRLADVMAEDTVDEDKVMETAREVRAVTCPYV